MSAVKLRGCGFVIRGSILIVVCRLALRPSPNGASNHMAGNNSKETIVSKKSIQILHSRNKQVSKQQTG